MKTRTEVIVFLLCILIIPIASVIREGWSVLTEMKLWFLMAGFIFLVGVIAYFISKAKDKRRKRIQDKAIAEYNAKRAETIRRYNETHSG